MEIAISIYGNYLIAFKDSKGCLGSFSGLKSLSLVAIFCPDGDPLNVMLGEHGMVNGTYLNGYDIILYFINGYVLFCGTVGYSRLDLLHFLTAADQRTACLFNDRNDLSANGTTIEFKLHVLPPCWLQPYRLI
jgi:hypothetical protein